MTQYFGEESAFNEKVTFFKNANINGNLNVEEQSTFGSTTVTDLSARSLNASGIVTATEFYGNGGNLTGIAVTANVRTNSLVVSGVSTIGNTIIGGGTTELIVNGNARITGILTVGNSSVTINGFTNTISGISSVTDDIGGYVSIPPGAVQFFARDSAPSGWLKANGASLNTTTYSSLFSAIGYTFGGSGASFNVPDLRGEFPRGWDDSRGVDSGRSFGSSQAEMINQHRHWISSMATDDRNITGTGGNGQEYGLVSDAGSYSADDPNKATGRFTRNDPGFGSNNETRPRNIALLACIKY